MYLYYCSYFSCHTSRHEPHTYVRTSGTQVQSMLPPTYNLTSTHTKFHGLYTLRMDYSLVKQKWRSTVLLQPPRRVVSLCLEVSGNRGSIHATDTERTACLVSVLCNYDKHSLTQIRAKTLVGQPWSSIHVCSNFLTTCYSIHSHCNKLYFTIQVGGVVNHIDNGIDNQTNLYYRIFITPPITDVDHEHVPLMPQVP